MSTKLNPPSFVCSEKMYEHWKTKIKTWELVTDVPKAKRRMAIALYYLFWTTTVLRLESKFLKKFPLMIQEKKQALKLLEKYEEFKNC